VKLFHLMREMYLDQLAMGGGEGRELLRRINYEALRRLNRALRQLLISTSVKGYFSFASARGFLAPQLRLVADLPVMTTV